MRIEKTTDAPYKLTKRQFYFSPRLIKRRKKEKKKEKEESLKPRVIEGQNTGYIGKCYTCPITATKFQGSCPITPCNYNITDYNKSNSCCLAIETQKTEFDKWDLQQALGISESKLYKLKEAGELRVRSVIAFYQIFNSIRDRAITKKSSGNIANFMEHSHLNIEEFHARKQDFDLVQENIEEIREKASKIDSRLTLERVLGLTEKTI